MECVSQTNRSYHAKHPFAFSQNSSAKTAILLIALAMISIAAAWCLEKGIFGMDARAAAPLPCIIGSIFFFFGLVDLYDPLSAK